LVGATHLVAASLRNVVELAELVGGDDLAGAGEGEDALSDIELVGQIAERDLVGVVHRVGALQRRGALERAPVADRELGVELRDLGDRRGVDRGARGGLGAVGIDLVGAGRVGIRDPELLGHGAGPVEEQHLEVEVAASTIVGARQRDHRAAVALDGRQAGRDDAAVFEVDDLEPDLAGGDPRREWQRSRIDRDRVDRRRPRIDDDDRRRHRRWLLALVLGLVAARERGHADEQDHERWLAHCR